jgi:anhydro-N-acetylmuramic acid kinase
MYGFMPTPTRNPFRWNGHRPRLIVGVLSGTSADAVSACLVRVTERSGRLNVKELAFLQRPYPAGMREFILRNSLPGSSSVDILTRLNAAIGEFFGETVVRLARRARVPLAAIDLIGSHGQTVHHVPNAGPLFGVRSRGTLQIGDPSFIAQRTGTVTVGDFRTADMAVGGQGAPLVPYLDATLFASPSRSRLLLNLGGIANFTIVPAGHTLRHVRAFDTGPANMVIDALAERLLKSRFDRDGRTARRGHVIPSLLTWMMSHRYLSQKPPKSTGREMFGAMFVGELIRRGRHASTADLLATATEFTARSIVQQYRRFIRPSVRCDEVLVSGGGAHNRFLMDRIREQFAPILVRATSAVGFSIDAKEAILFALLARAAVLGRPANLPSVTGATRPVILGKICVP